MDTQGTRIKHYRQLKGWNQQDLAIAVQAKQSTVSMLENDEMNPSTDLLKRLALALGVSTDLILFGTQPTATAQEEVSA